MIPVAVIRPEPGCSSSVAAARTLGLPAQGFPLFAVVPRAWIPPAPGDADVLLIGSANAIRHGGDALFAVKHLPVHAVGETTAAVAREAGFTVSATGSGGLQSVLDAVPPGTRVLRLAGEERVPLVAPPGVILLERVVYASEPLPLPEAFAELLADGALVLVHSGAAARHFAAECDRLEIPRKTIHLATLAPRVAAAAGRGWASLSIAPKPQDEALLALAGQLCQSDDETRG